MTTVLELSGFGRPGFYFTAPGIFVESLFLCSSSLDVKVLCGLRRGRQAALVSRQWRSLCNIVSCCRPFLVRFDYQQLNNNFLIMSMSHYISYRQSVLGLRARVFMLIVEAE